MYGIIIASVFLVDEYFPLALAIWFGHLLGWERMEVQSRLAPDFTFYAEFNSLKVQESNLWWFERSYKSNLSLPYATNNSWRNFLEIHRMDFFSSNFFFKFIKYYNPSITHQRRFSKLMKLILSLKNDQKRFRSMKIFLWHMHNYFKYINLHGVGQLALNFEFHISLSDFSLNLKFFFYFFYQYINIYQ